MARPMTIVLRPEIVEKDQKLEAVPVIVPVVEDRPLCTDSQVIDLSGERGRNRTYNLLIKSQLLCQLSYAP